MVGDMKILDGNLDLTIKGGVEKHSNPRELDVYSIVRVLWVWWSV